MEFCPHCIRPCSDDVFCPRCGKQVNWVAGVNQLPVGTELRGSDGHIYQIGAVLGQGGFGITYAAADQYHVFHKDHVAARLAIKEYFPSWCACRTQYQVRSLGGKQEAFRHGLEKFLEEAQTLITVNALPSVVSAKDCFEANGTAYLVMEYVDGMPLHKAMDQRKQKFQASELLPMMVPLLKDLEILHRAGIIHRDISPDNLVLTPEGKLKLLDFGSARSLHRGQMTVIVKKGFSPVEQAMGTEQSSWTDVYALASTIYYCLTNTLPPDSLEREFQLRQGNPDPLRRPNELGAGLSEQEERALLWGMAVQPKDRPQSAEEFRKALVPEKKKLFEPTPPAQNPDPGPKPDPVNPQKKWLLPALLGVAALLIVLLIVLVITTL